MSNESNVPAVVAQTQDLSVLSNSFFGDIKSFENGQRMSKVFAGSDIVPDVFKNNIGNCMIALEMSNRMGANPLAVMQNLYIVHGKPAWSSQFLISCINASGRFTPLRYKFSGTGDERSCIAWAKDATGEVLESPAVSIAMAKAEGWFQKNGSKWKTMPDLMLSYRSAAFFARLYAPELTMGIQSEHEIIDITPFASEVNDMPKVSKFEQKKATSQLLSVPAVKTDEELVAIAIKDNFAGITVEQFMAHVKRIGYTVEQALDEKEDIISATADWIAANK